ncbi:MAG: S9 family peptidase [Marinifilaceae bacterium]|jgi:dipeptidyl aminopeptidase/acylaminoacyl peptidase|nr:S9 family peptidase [Marinifilaceae bacterium]
MKSNYIYKILFLYVLLSIFCPITRAQDRNIYDRYQEAENWLWCNVSKKVYRNQLDLNWSKDGNSLCYKINTRKGIELYYVNIKAKKKIKLIETKLLKKKIDSIFNKKCDLNQIRKIEFINDSVFFKYNDNKFVFSRETKELKLIKKIHNNKTELISPNGKLLAFIKNNNLFIKNIESGIINQLSYTKDKHISYGNSYSWYYVKNESSGDEDEYEIEAYWSPDSKKIICAKFDRTYAKKLYMYKSSPEKGYRAEVYSYERPIAGDSLTATKSYVVFDIESATEKQIDLKPIVGFLQYEFKWFNNRKAYCLRYKRGYKSRNLVEVDVITGKSRIIINEKSKTYVDPNNFSYYVDNVNNYVIWTSEKDNYNQLYLYDYENGDCLHKITKEKLIVRKIHKVDIENKKIFFTASGLEKGDPYLKYLYSISYNGEKLSLLSKESANHNVSVSPNSNYFIDKLSRIDKPVKSYLRDLKSGKIILNLEEADIHDILKMGWKPPQLVKFKARDNKTDLYATVFYPFDFDSSKSYPVIDASYSGPQTIRSPKTFNRALLNMDIALAQLGFIVVTIDGLGSAFRSKKFHDYSYKNLGDIGAPDHIKFIKDFALKNNYVNLDKIGIYGHSAGGYDATHALLVHPEFYKVAVSSAGNHDHRSAKAWWPELYMGYPAGENYDRQSNFNLAKNLRGKLLLAHGNMDNNVNPAATMRMADELIKNNKDFDLLLIPDKDHGGLYYDKYFIRRRWDFFVKHLLEIKPPNQYKIK